MPQPPKRVSMKEALLKKTQHSYEHRDDSGQFKSIFREGLTFWKCKSGEHLIDIIPYWAGSKDPGTPEGEPTYVLILFVHYSVGTNQDAYVCPARNYGKPCPICEYREELRSQEDYDEDLVKELNPKKRSIYNVVVYDNEKEQAKGVQVWDVAHWYMEKHLSALAKVPERGIHKTASYIAFSDPEDGKMISFERKGDKKNSEFLAHKFVDRDYVISQEILDMAKSIDNYIEIYSYEEIKKAFYGESEEGIEPEVEEEVETPSPALKPRKAVDSPSPARKAPLAAPPPARKPINAPADNCPAGGVFGVDCTQLEACNGCEVWDDCSTAADVIAAEGAESEPEPEPPKPAPRPAAPRPAAPRPAPAVGARPAPRPIKR